MTQVYVFLSLNALEKMQYDWHTTGKFWSKCFSMPCSIGCFVIGVLHIVIFHATCCVSSLFICAFVEKKISRFVSEK